MKQTSMQLADAANLERANLDGASLLKAGLTKDLQAWKPASGKT